MESASRPPVVQPTVAITGARGALGQALLRRFHRRGARLIALTHRREGEEMAPLYLLDSEGEEIPLRLVGWECGKEEELATLLRSVDVLVLNHGVNPIGRRDAEGLALALEVNALSHWRLLELFARAVAERGERAGEEPESTSRPPAEVWVNTSEAEIQPALSPLYEISKRLIGHILSLRSLDLASSNRGGDGPPPLRLRRLVLGPFRSELNPYGVLTADWVAGEILRQADWDWGLILVSINPLTYIGMPLNTLGRWLYGRGLTRSTRSSEQESGN